MANFSNQKSKQNGLVIKRFFTEKNKDPYSYFEYELRTSRITNPDGSVVFEMKDIEVPKGWSQVATDILAQKYCRKKGVPQRDQKGKLLKDDTGNVILGAETSAKMVVARLASTWRYWGEKNGYFASADSAQAFEAEMIYMLLSQMTAPNSPQWFNTGLAHAYGITGDAQGHYYVDPKTEKIKKSKDAYTRPQPHACFIQSLDDDLVNEGGIFDLVTREARLFKYGSGTGTNFSKLRGVNEHLSGGGKSSGLMSFLTVFDRAAGAIKSGGTTRRAAKMVCLDMDHPEIEDFIDWKLIEEQKVASLHTGSQICYEQLKGIVQSAYENGLDGEKNPDLRKKIHGARAKHVPLNYVKRVLMLVEHGMKPEEFSFRRYDMDFRSEAYLTVGGQNSNNSVRVPNAFVEAVKNGSQWNLINRKDGTVYKTLSAVALWDKIAYAAWSCADPGIQFDTTINEWHTCPEDGRIKASNPCVTGDTLVATSQGLRKIVDLVGKQVEIFDRFGARRSVDAVFKTGFKKIYELKTKSGYRLKVTDDHLIFTKNRGFVPAVHLKEGDKMCLGSISCFGQESLEPFFAEALGLAVGDGCITSGQEMLFITLSKEETSIAQKINSFFSDYKNRFSMDGRSSRATAVAETPTTVRVNTSSRTVVNIMKKYALLACGSANKQFSDAIYELDSETVACVLRGLFTADGTVANYANKSQYVSLDSSSITLLIQVQLLLLSFGIKSKLYENRRSGKTTSILPDGKGGAKVYPVVEVHSLRISRSSRNLFEQKIGFMETSSKVLQLKQLNQQVSTYQDDFTDEFVSLAYFGEEDVYDLTEPVNHAFFANGILVHNCSEYMFLDDTACNLASLNLIKFYNNTNKKFDVQAFSHAVRLWTVVLEISVLMAQFPSKAIAQLSYDFRTLGLGYANIGTMLMRMGIPYTSEQAYAITGAITAIMCGESYAVSAEMAKILGPFKKYQKNKDHMLRVIRNHRRAAYNEPKHEYEGLTATPAGINSDFCPEYLLFSAKKAWDRALQWGEQSGYRNAQVTVIAPTGTIGLLMDCDTTGIEPDFALVKFKKLVGGGYFKIVNQSLPPALETLGYSQKQIEDIANYVRGHATLNDCPYINAKSLKAKGFTDKEILAVEAQLLGVFELKFAFNRFSLGEEFCRNVLGLSDAEMNDLDFDMLLALGFSREQTEEANEYVCGTMTIEGAPHLKKEHYPVFDCANKCGKKGRRYIPYVGHLRMMAAAQPFISGSISKTINMPEECSVSDIQKAYMESWELMLKCNAIYRDNSKLSQPLNSSGGSDPFSQLFSFENMENIDETVGPQIIHQNIEKVVQKPMRRKLPEERHSITHKFSISGHEGYITVGLYGDGQPGEIFIKMSKEGSTLSGIMDALALSVSMNLQYGVPLEVLVAKFCHSRFEPSGMTGNRDIPMVKSIIDYLGRWLALKFLSRDAAKKYHNSDLVDRAYNEGTNLFLPQVPVEHAPSFDLRAGITRTHRLPEQAMTAVGTEHCSVPTAVIDASNLTREEFAKIQKDRALYLNNEDAAMCSACGAVMVRNGSCYKCLDCGETSGCS